nr:MAG TPA: hypothetical protein [Bacteriophage sp.]
MSVVTVLLWYHRETEKEECFSIGHLISPYMVFFEKTPGNAGVFFVAF